MANKHLTEDEIRYTVDVKTADAQKAIYTLEQQSKKLRSDHRFFFLLLRFHELLA